MSLLDLRVQWDWPLSSSANSIAEEEEDLPWDRRVPLLPLDESSNRSCRLCTRRRICRGIMWRYRRCCRWPIVLRWRISNHAIRDSIHIFKKRHGTTSALCVVWNHHWRMSQCRDSSIVIIPQRIWNARMNRIVYQRRPMNHRRLMIGNAFPARFCCCCCCVRALQAVATAAAVVVALGCS